MDPNKALASYLSGLDRRRCRIKVTDISVLCGISRDVVLNWKHGRSRIPAKLLPKITKAIGKDIFTDC